MTPPASSWARFTAWFVAAGLGVGAVLVGLIAAADPFGIVRPADAALARPILDGNQRFVYPQIVRSGRYDAAVLGTSSVRLLDPARLSALFGTRFMTLGMNAATPWEQARMAALLRRETPDLKAVVWGLDVTWCEPDADTPAKRLTPRPFPDWLYERASLIDLPKVLNLTTLEIAARWPAVLLGGERAGAAKVRRDGFDEFTPPDSTYDPARARWHLLRYTDGRPPAPSPKLAEVPEPGQGAPDTARFPALAWLDRELSAMPAATRKLLVLPPVHVASLPGVDSPLVERDLACKSAIVALARRVGASVVDYRLDTPLTRNDTAFWDPLHYRVGIADRIATDLAAVDGGAGQVGDGVVRHRQGR